MQAKQISSPFFLLQKRFSTIIGRLHFLHKVVLHHSGDKQLTIHFFPKQFFWCYFRYHTQQGTDLCLTSPLGAL